MSTKPGQLHSSAPQEREYSDWGELKSVTWTPAVPEPKHRTVSTYDAFGRVTSTYEDNDGLVDPATLNKFTYDVGVSEPYLTPTNTTGRLTSATTPTDMVALSYDGYGRVNARTFTDTSGGTYAEQQTFHGDGSQASIQLQLPDAMYVPERMDYAYDTAGRLRWMWFSDGMNTAELFNASTVDAWGRLRAADLGKTQFAASFDDVGRRLPKYTKLSSPSGTRSIAYNSFDAIGRELSRNEDMPGVGGQEDTTYDALGRLQTSLRHNGVPAISKWAFTYDPLGNITKLDDQLGTQDASMSFTSTDRDRICAVSYTGAPGACNVGYDSFGNITSEPTHTGSNKLTYFNGGDVRTISNELGRVATFAYDAFGGLQDLSIVEGINPVRHDHHYGSFITSRSQNGAAGEASYIAREFPGPGLGISRRGPSGKWIFEFSESRGTRFTTDDSGGFVQDITYTPFGSAKSTGAAPGATEFSTDQWNDGDALEGFGLLSVGARVYDPSLGRFLSRDPLVVPRSSASTNPYAFALNDPLNLSDPSGMDPCAQNATCSITAFGGQSDTGDAALVGLAMFAAEYFYATGIHPGTPQNNPTFPELATYNAALDAHLNQLQINDFFTVDRGPSTLDVITDKIGDVAAIGTGAVGFAAGFALCSTWVGCALGGPMMGLSADMAGAHVTSLVTSAPARSFVTQQLGARAGALEDAVVGGFSLASAVTTITAAGAVGSPSEVTTPAHVNLASPQRTIHILDGEAGGGGGHRYPGNPGKTLFPRSWSDARIMHEVSDIVTDPALTWTRQGQGTGFFYRSGNPARYFVVGERGGIQIKVVVEPMGEGIITAHPIPSP